MQFVRVFTYLVLYAVFLMLCEGSVDFTNAECIVKDKSYVRFKTCLLKSVNRTYKYFSMRAEFPRRQPVDNITVKAALLRKTNGYKPFLYNFTFDACKYMKRRNNPVIKYLHAWFEKYSTINRTCPYGPQDELVDKLPISHVSHYVTNVLPMPSGDYVLHTEWYFYNILVAIVKVYARF